MGQAPRTLDTLRAGIRYLRIHGFSLTSKRLLNYVVSKNAPPEIAAWVNPPKVVVALTASPDRLPQAQETIASLMAQSRKPDQIVVWLQSEVANDELGSLQADAVVLRLDDTRPGAWLAATLREHCDSVVVTASHDRIYPTNWLALLYNSFLNETAPLVHCHRLVRSLCPDGGWHLLDANPTCYPQPTYLSLRNVAAGVLIPPVAIDLDAIDAATELAPGDDDMWLWLMAVLGRAKTKVVQGGLSGPDYSPAGQVLNAEVFDNHESLGQKLQAEYQLMRQVDTALRVPQREKTTAYFEGLDPALLPAELMLWYHKATGMCLNLDNPRTINEKMQWLKLYDSTSMKARLADKYLVRDWVAETIGEQYLIPLLGVWDRFDDIDFDALPNQFVLKTNHGSGWVIIVRDKSKFDVVDARIRLNKWMATNFTFEAGFEMHYRHMVPKILAEELIGTTKTNDYRFWCFDGQVHYIMIDIDRATDHRRVVFDTNWQLQSYAMGYDLPDAIPERPPELDTMIRLAGTLSKGFPQVRVDMYCVDHKIYFGEMTFTSTSGTRPTPPEFAYELGALTVLPSPTPLIGSTPGKLGTAPES